MSKTYLSTPAIDLLKHLAGVADWRTAEELATTTGYDTFSAARIASSLVGLGLAEARRSHGEVVYRIDERGYDWLADDDESVPAPTERLF